MVKDFSRFQSVGIRLCDREEFPCFADEGFPDRCDEAENPLCGPDEPGTNKPEQGEMPAPKCVCVRIIRSETDPDLPFFTQAGSFWTNSRSHLLASPYADQIRCRVRDRFDSEGFESLAIVALRSGADVIGLLQLSDRRKDRLSPDMVRTFETIGNVIGIVLARIRAEEELLRGKSHLENCVQERTAELVAANQRLQQEIDDRTTLEQNLLLSQQRLELAMQAANLGSWDWNVSTGDVFFDQLWSSFSGYTADEGESGSGTWNNLVHPDDKLRVLRALKSHLDNPANYYEAEYRLQAKTGEWRWVLDRGKVVETDQAGKPLRMAGIYFDITDRKRIEEQLHDNAERLRGIFESARDCIFVKDASLKYTHVNPYFATIVDLPESQIVGRTDEELFGKAAAEILREADRRVLKGESIEQEHTRTIRGASATFLDVKVPMRNTRGHVVGIIGISREITARIRLSPRSALSNLIMILQPCGNAASSPPGGRDGQSRLTRRRKRRRKRPRCPVHPRHSKRSGGPFFSINCAAVAPELAESELFGYDSGAFTGARGTKKGLLELAEGGSILLNEIGELSLALQAKLLTFLDTRQFTRVGGVKVRSVSARLIAATNRDLEKEVQLKRFRHDLFYRLDVFTIEVPPLRQRTEDIPDLVRELVRELSDNLGLDSAPAVDAQGLKALTDYHWPGNVRELRNVLERALILSDKQRIKPGDLNVHNKHKPLDAGQEWSIAVGFPEGETLNDVTYEVKRRLVTEALRRSNGTRNAAARLLGISIDSLKHYMRVFDLYG